MIQKNIIANKLSELGLEYETQLKVMAFMPLCLMLNKLKLLAIYFFKKIKGNSW